MRKPMLDVGVFKERRERLKSMIAGGALILPSHPEHVRNNDVHHPYRQDSNFVYLTGFEEPESVFMFIPGAEHESVLFVRDKDLERETWDGFRFGPEGAKQEFSIDAAYSIHDFEELAPMLLKDVERVYYSQFHHLELDLKIHHVLESVKTLNGRSGRGNLPIEDSYPLLGEMRICKTEFEIGLMRKAGEITCEAHKAVMRQVRPGVNERALHGLFLKEVMERGAAREAYHGIFASGDSATTLHYVFNDQPCGDGDMLLVDAGAEYFYYAGDVTRTYPVSGRFNEAQKRVYSRLLDLQKELVASVRPGLTMVDLQKKTTEGLVDLMIEEKLLKGNRDRLVTDQAYRKYYPHGVGHWLGLDVHDAGLSLVKGEPRKFAPGMVFTIEPGLYVPFRDEEAPQELRGMGIRIEDNIVVTEDGYENLTEGVPKEVADLEAIIGQG